MSGSELVVDRRPGLLLVGLARPAKRNALDANLAEQFRTVLRQARSGPPSVLVVHSLVPGMFVSGADIAELRQRRAEDALLAINAGLFEDLEAFRWPSIAVIDGDALGGGCELALACDFRLGGPAARFAQPEPSLGIMAGAGGNWRLAETVGVPMARRMLYAGHMLDARSALSCGLLDELADDPSTALENAIRMAERIGTRSWRALELTKLALRLHRPVTTTFDLVGQALLFEDPEKDERMDAFLQRRRRS